MIQIKVNKRIPGFEPGKVVNVESDANGTPKDIFWRKRLKDSVMDGCCEVVEQPKPRKPKRTEAQNDNSTSTKDNC